MVEANQGTSGKLPARKSSSRYMHLDICGEKGVTVK